MNQSKKHQVPRNLNDHPDCYKNNLLQNIQINVQVFQFCFRRIALGNVHTSSNVEKILNVRAVFGARESSLPSYSKILYSMVTKEYLKIYNAPNINSHFNMPWRWNSNFQWKAYMELSAWRVFNFYFGPKVKVTHQNWGPRSSRSHFSILGLKNWENSNAEKIE